MEANPYGGAGIWDAEDQKWMRNALAKYSGPIRTDLKLTSDADNGGSSWTQNGSPLDGFMSDAEKMFYINLAEGKGSDDKMFYTMPNGVGGREQALQMAQDFQDNFLPTYVDNGNEGDDPITAYLMKNRKYEPHNFDADGYGILDSIASMGPVLIPAAFGAYFGGLEGGASLLGEGLGGGLGTGIDAGLAMELAPGITQAATGAGSGALAGAAGGDAGLLFGGAAGMTPEAVAAELAASGASPLATGTGLFNTATGAYTATGLPSLLETLQQIPPTPPGSPGTQPPAPVETGTPSMNPGNPAPGTPGYIPGGVTTAAQQSALSRILNGTATTDDWLKIAGTAGSTLAGMWNSNQQANSLSDIANQQLALREPYRQKSLQYLNDPKSFYGSTEGGAAMEALLQRLSPVGGVSDPYKQSLATGALYDRYRGTVEGLGNLGLSGQTGIVGPQMAAANASGGVLTNLAGGLSDIINPKPQQMSQADLLKLIIGGATA